MSSEDEGRRAESQSSQRRQLTFSDIVRLDNRLVQASLQQRRQEQLEQFRARDKKRKQLQERAEKRLEQLEAKAEAEWSEEEGEEGDEGGPRILMRMPDKNQGTEQLLVQSSDGELKFVKRVRFNRGFRSADVLREVATTLKVGRESNPSGCARYLGFARDMAFNGKNLELHLEKGDMNLTDFISKNCESHPHIGELVLFLLLQIARALNFVHSDLESVLGNLTPDSIMVRDTQGVPTIFISSLKHMVPAVPREQLERNFRFTVRTGAKVQVAGEEPDRDGRDTGYSAPEVVENPSSFASQQGDVWSYGALMLWIISGQVIGRDPKKASLADYIAGIRDLTEPSGQNEEVELAFFINKALNLCKNGGCDPRSEPAGARCARLLQAMPPNAARLFVTLMRHCLQPEPANRPTMQEIVDHELFEKVKQGGFESVKQMLDAVESATPADKQYFEEMRRQIALKAKQIKELQESFKAIDEVQVQAQAGGVGGAGVGGEESTFPTALRNTRNQIATSLHAQLTEAAPELSVQLTAAVLEGMAHADKVAIDKLGKKVTMAEYAANLLAGFDFALNVGSELSFETRRQVLKQAAHSLNRNAIKLTADEVLNTQEALLFMRSPSMFADNEVLAESRKNLTPQVLKAAVKSPLSTFDFVRQI